MPPTFAKIYTNFVARQETNRTRLLEEATKRELVKELFKQGVNTLEEFGDAREGRRGIAETLNSSGIRVSTPFVALEFEGKELNFIMQGFKPDYLSPKSPLPDSYEYISVHSVKEGDRNFEVDDAWMFRIHAGEIITPPNQVNNDPEVIEAASDLFDAIQQSLSETHTPRSQQVKSETGKRGLLVNIFRQLKPAGKL